MVKKLLSAGLAFFSENVEIADDSQLLLWKEKFEAITHQQSLTEILQIVISGHSYDSQKHSFMVSFYFMDGVQASKIRLSSEIVVAASEIRKNQKLTSALHFSGGSSELAELFKKYFSDKIVIEALDENLYKSRLHLSFRNSKAKIDLPLSLSQYYLRVLVNESHYTDSFLSEVSYLWVDHCHFAESDKSNLTFSFCNDKMTFYTFRLKIQKPIEDLKKFTDSDFFVADRYKHLKPSSPFFKVQFQNGLITFLSVTGEVLARFVALK